MLKVLRQKWFLLAIILLVVIYLGSRLFRLTYLPVFADEAIYLRWSQLIISDRQQYLFFPMNDGKTPLFMWLCIPFLLTFSDPLFAGRLVSVLVGAAQIFVIMSLVKNFGGGKKSQLLGALLVALLPGWFFYERLALIDGLLTLFLSLTFLFTKKSITILNDLKLGKKIFQQKSFKLLLLNVLLAGLFFGAAFWTKFSALVFAPVIMAACLLFSKRKIGTLLFQFFVGSVVIFLGGALFLTLKLTPVFSQIFARGGDFLYSWQTIFTPEIFAIFTRNSSNFISYLSSYVTAPLLIFTLLLAIFFAFRQEKNRQPLYLILLAVIFILPLAILGKVVYPRYLLPALIFFTTSLPLLLSFCWHTHFKFKKLLVSVILASIIFISARFMFASFFDLSKLPLHVHDQGQYLTTWSAGFGIPETVQYLEETAKTQKVLVLTEGYFGTLPDALLMYFFNRDVTNLTIEGIGQPIVSLPADKVARFGEYDKIILVVNSYRQKIDLNSNKQLHLIAQFARPLPDEQDGPITLQLFEIDKNYEQ